MIKFLIKWTIVYVVIWALASLYLGVFHPADIQNEIAALNVRREALQTQMDKVMKTRTEQMDRYQRIKEKYKEYEKKRGEAGWYNVATKVETIYEQGICLKELVDLGKEMMDTEHEIMQVKAPLMDIEKELRTKIAPSMWHRFLTEFFGNAPLIAAKILCLMWLLPVGWRIFAYFILAPWLSRRPDIHLFDGESGNVELLAQTPTAYATQTLELTVSANNPLTVKCEDFIKGYDASPGDMKKSTVWMMNWSSWLMCWLSGLVLMTRFNTRKRGGEKKVVLSSDDPDQKFVKVDLLPVEEYFILPATLVAYSGKVRVRCRWRIFKLVSWCIGQIRYYSISGDGYVVLSSSGGMCRRIVGSEHEQVKKLRTVALSSSNVRISVARTETFVPYLFGKTDLFDMRLRGEGVVVTLNSALAAKTSVMYVRDTVFTAIGKFFGF